MLDFLVLIDEVWIAARMLVNHGDAPFTDKPTEVLPYSEPLKPRIPEARGRP
jgi:hypothetical protein